MVFGCIHHTYYFAAGNIMILEVWKMIEIMDAAHYFVYLSYHVKGGSLTPLKLQKLLYLYTGMELGVG